jgi:hypothetical protein
MKNPPVILVMLLLGVPFCALPLCFLSIFVNQVSFIWLNLIHPVIVFLWGGVYLFLLGIGLVYVLIRLVQRKLDHDLVIGLGWAAVLAVPLLGIWYSEMHRDFGSRLHQQLQSGDRNYYLTSTSYLAANSNHETLFILWDCDQWGLACSQQTVIDDRYGLNPRIAPTTKTITFDQ